MNHSIISSYRGSNDVFVLIHLEINSKMFSVLGDDDDSKEPRNIKELD